jgi:plasmid maintenance system antidote protein VapI
MTMAVSPQLRGRYKARPELEELLAERLGAHHRRAVAERLDVTYEAARLWLTGGRTVTPDVATRLARIAGKTRAELFTEADK